MVKPEELNRDLQAYPSVSWGWSSLNKFHVLAGKQAAPNFIYTTVYFCQGFARLVPTKERPKPEKNHTNFLLKIEVEILKAALSYLPALTTSLTK